MELSEKTSTPVSSKHQRYDCSEKGKARHRRYAISEKGREAQYRYNYSLKGKQRDKRYKQSPKGIVARYRWGASVRCVEYKREYNQCYRLEHPDNQRDRYYRIQDEAGCYMAVDSFYPGYRFLKALETAKVVEI